MTSGSRRSSVRLGTILAAMCLGMVIASGRLAGAQQTTLVSVSSDGNQTPQFIHSSDPAISNDGRYVAFASIANNLVPGTTGNLSKVFLHDRLTGLTTLVSISSTGAQGLGSSQRAALALGGQLVAFDSSAGNLVLGDTNGAGDIFVHDRNSALTVRASVSSAGRQTFSASTRPAISADGRFVAFDSPANDLVLDDDNGVVDVFVHDLTTGETTRASHSAPGIGNGSSLNAAISANGRYVVFESNSSNLVGDDTNGASDIFVRDLATGLTERVSLAMGGGNPDSGSFNARISGDGRFVAFESDAANLVPNDTNRLPGFSGRDIFVHDRLTGLTERVSVDSAGTQNLVSSNSADISADGRYVAFLTIGTLVAGDTNQVIDVFVHDRVSRETTRVSLDSSGAQSNGGLLFSPVLSGNGGFVAFESDADNLVTVDVNFARDIFVHERGVANRPPEARAGDVIVTAGAACMADASIDDGSLDPDGDPVTITQDPPGPYPLGVTEVTLTVTDNQGAASQAVARVTVIDTTPPDITAPPPAFGTTGGAGSTAVSAVIGDAALGMAMATDNCPVLVSRTGVPAGNVFPLGSTTITYTATDSSGNASMATQEVVVSDDTPPIVNVPANITVIASSAAGATVNFAANATDNVGVVSFSCAPASGSVFPVGATTVNCEARDGAGNATTASFLVRVGGVAEQIVALIEQLRGMPLPLALRAQLVAILQAVLASPQRIASACRGLDIVIALVRLQGNRIPAATAEQIIAAATGIQSVLGCP